MSADIIWECIRSNHAFLRPGLTMDLSREIGNALNKNSLKYSGLLPNRCAGLDLHKTGKKVSIVLTTSATGLKRTQPHKIFSSTRVTSNSRLGEKTIQKVLGSARPAAVQVSLVKYMKLKKSLRK